MDEAELSYLPLTESVDGILDADVYTSLEMNKISHVFIVTLELDLTLCILILLRRNQMRINKSGLAH